MLFELEMLGGPWGKRLEARRAGFDDYPWQLAAEDTDEAQRASARYVWTQSAFSEYASAAAFAEIASCLTAAGAPIDLIAAAGDFIVDEVLHAELSARCAMTFGGAVELDVDLTKLVRPPRSVRPLLRAAELIVRTSCVGETLTLPILKTAKQRSRSPLIVQVIERIARDESAHAELGWWFLDWAEPDLTDEDRSHLAAVAKHAIEAFAPVFSGSCTPGSELGVLDCETYDAAFLDALERRVVAQLHEREIPVDAIPPVALEG